MLDHLLHRIRDVNEVKLYGIYPEDTVSIDRFLAVHGSTVKSLVLALTAYESRALQALSGWWLTIDVVL